MARAAESSPLPSFENPPVAEVAAGVQFADLEAMNPVRLGAYWSKIKDRFPKIDLQPPLNRAEEEFGSQAKLAASTPGISLLQGPPILRVWMTNDASTELIQVQKNRFVYNWRKQKNEVYARFIEHIRPRFTEEFSRFCEFVESEELGAVKPDLCELTYVNHISSDEGWEHHGQAQKVMTPWSGTYNDEFLPEPERVDASVNYVMRDSEGTPLGRLHVNFRPAWDRAEQTPIFLLRLMARGKPGGDGVDGVLVFLEWAHEWIVRGFTSMTTERMHEIWQRQQ